MAWNWFDIAWPWIGLAVAVILLGLLLGTDLLRGEDRASRWFDPVWLSWLAMAAYLVHNGEEYGLDLFGRLHAFPGALCTSLGMPEYPACPVPPPFYMSVNIGLFWVAAPIAALLSRRHPLLGLSIYGVIFINVFAHATPLVAGLGYSPGTLTAFLIFLPLSAWVAFACLRSEGVGYSGLAVIVADGVVVHAVLMGSLQLFTHGKFGGGALVAIQVANAVLLLLVAWLGERWIGRRMQASPAVASGRWTKDGTRP